MSTHLRQLAICTFADEKSPEPIKKGLVPWSIIVELHADHKRRPDKSGRMLGGYALNGSRNNTNVLLRSVIQLDIDTEGSKDKPTGRILKVTRRAPELEELRASIDQYEWIAASSHWHQPQRGVIKYRIVMLPDRDIYPAEWNFLLEALDELLGGALDRGAWQWSQAFYLPSCPAENHDDAFFVHNEGPPLPVDELIQRGREIIATREAKNPPADLKRKSSLTAQPETAENIARVNSMLLSIDPDVSRLEWRQTCWSVMATGWQCAEQLIREWSMRGQKFELDAFADVVRDFDSDAGTGFGTLVHIAKQNGWIDRSLIDGEEFTGNGGDVKSGQIFAERFRNELLHIHEINEWLRFDSERGWLAAPPGEADRAAKEVLEMMRNCAAERYKLAPDAPITKRQMAHVARTSNAQHLRAMVEMAKSEPGMTAQLRDFDADPMLLGVANGVLDLKTHALLSVSPDVLVSKRCNVAYDSNAECPRFEQFMQEVQPDSDVRTFLQRWVGYCMTGCTDEQKFIFLHGQGANGKSVFIELIAWLLGDYAHKIQTEILMHHQRSSQGPSPDIVALKGKRFIYANETEEGRRLADARIKELTGGDTLNARAPYGKADITFRPTCKLIIAGNHKLEISDASNGMWRRVMLILFAQSIAPSRRDPKLLERLKGEGAGILNWALRGLKEWQRNGLQVPAAIEASTTAYRDEQDIIGEWITDRCQTGTGCREAKGVLYANYTSWAIENGHRPLAQVRLTRRLTERGYRAAPDKRTVTGIALKPLMPAES